MSIAVQAMPTYPFNAVDLVPFVVYSPQWKKSIRLYLEACSCRFFFLPSTASVTQHNNHGSLLQSIGPCRHRWCPRTRTRTNESYGFWWCSERKSAGWQAMERCRSVCWKPSVPYVLCTSAPVTTCGPRIVRSSILRCGKR